MRPDLFLATIGRGSNGSNALEVTEDRAAVTAESQDNIINRVNNISQYGPSWHYVPGIGVAGTAYAEVPGSALGDLTFTRASSKTRTNSAGVVETIASNVPPHDYRNADGTLSTFPRLNLEPQRINTALYSEMFSDVAWSKGATSVTANTSIAPNGTLTADTLTADGTNSIHTLSQNGSATNGVVYTQSLYAKSGTNNFIQIIGTSAIYTSATVFANFDLLNGTVGSSGGGAIATITNVGNGWYRCTMTATATATTSGSAFLINIIPTSTSTRGAASALTTSVLIWGAQVEAGSYATSYIPTTTAAVTRLADTASKTGVSSLIGQTEGTLFVEINKTQSGYNYYSISDGTSNNWIFVGLDADSPNLIRGYVRTVTGITADIKSGVIANGTVKMAIAYKLNDVVLYVNGTQIGTDISAAMPTGLSGFYLTGNVSSTSVTNAVNQAALFKTRLPNATLAQMTTL